MAWWDDYPDAPAATSQTPQQMGMQTYKPANWWDSYPDAPHQGESGANKAITEFAGESAEGLREIPGDIYRGAKETITEAPERYAAGYGSVNREGGPFQRVIGAPLAGAYEVIAGSPVGQVAMDVGLSGAPLTRGLANERTARASDVGRDVGLRVDEGRPGILADQAGGRAAPPEVRADVPRRVVHKGQATAPTSPWGEAGEDQFATTIHRMISTELPKLEFEEGGGDAFDRLYHAYGKMYPDAGSRESFRQRLGAIGISTEEGAGRGPDQFFHAEPGAEGKPQTLIPGVAPVTDKARAEARGAKPLRGGAAPLGGMFDEGKSAPQLFDQPARAGGATGLANLGGIGKGIADNLYVGLFKSLQEGKDTFAGIKDHVLIDAKPNFDAGLIKSPEDLKLFVSEQEAAKAGKASAPPVEGAPRKGANVSTVERRKAEDYRVGQAEGRARIEAAFEEAGLERPPNDATMAEGARRLRDGLDDDPVTAWENAERSLAGQAEHIESLGERPLGAAPGPPAAAPGAKATHANVIEQELEHYKLANREQLRRTEVRKALKSKPPELTPEVEQKLYAHAENDFSAGRLTPKEDALYEKHIEPWLERNKEIFKEIRSQGKKLGIADSEIEELHPGYMHRMVQGKTRDLDRAAGFEQHDPGTGASKGFGGTYQAPATKSRTYYAIVSKDGERRVAHAEGGHIYDAATGKLIKSRTEPKVGTKFTANGKEWTFAHAKTSEIEGVTETRYIKSASASVLNNYLELERMRDRLALVQRTQERFIHEGKATRNVKEAQAHKWAASKFPGMEGVYMDKRLVGAMDKFAPKAAEETLADYLVRAENFLNSTLFWNPLPHARNVFMHSVIERGWDNFKPWTYPGAAVDAKRAFTDVSTNSEIYQEVQKAGGATMLPRVANRDIFEKMVEGFEAPENKSALASLASKLAMPVRGLHDLVYTKFAQQGLWFSNDMAIMQRVREKIRRVPGMTVAKAVEELHKDIPDYRIPSEVLFPGKPGRLVSQTIAGRYTNLFLRFTRFHYSVAKTFIHPAADIVKGIANIKSPAARTEAINAVGKLVSLAVSYELMNVVGNKAVQGLTGDEKARIAMWGPLAYVRLIDDIVSGRAKDEASFIKAATAGLFSMSPLIEVGLQALGINYRLQPDYAYQKASPAGKAAAIAGQGIAPISQAQKYYERGPGYFASDITVGAGRTPMTDEEYKAFKKTPDYKAAHPRVRHEDAAAYP